jgi:hypothetical protein
MEEGTNAIKDRSQGWKERQAEEAEEAEEVVAAYSKHHTPYTIGIAFPP